MGYPSDRIRLVLNRADSRVGITQEDVVQVIGRTPDVMVPSDREIARSVNEGMPIVAAKSHSNAAKAFNRLASMYNGASPATTNGRFHLKRNKEKGSK
jgi:pilus assembly protein CpaE